MLVPDRRGVPRAPVTGACGDPPKQLNSSCSAECHPEGCLPPAAVVLLVMLLQPRAVTLRDERVTEGHRDTISETGSPMSPPLGAPATADWECCADAATACAACPLVSPSLSTFCSLPCTLTGTHSLTHTITHKPKSTFDPLSGI